MNESEICANCGHIIYDGNSGPFHIFSCRIFECKCDTRLEACKKPFPTSSVID